MELFVSPYQTSKISQGYLDTPATSSDVAELFDRHSRKVGSTKIGTALVIPVMS
ncbi:hypothetical protein K8I28_00335 [bacterium]|nr:hypothetical protein [bacterium]